MTFRTLTPKENTMNAKLKQAWRSWMERRRQKRIDWAIDKMERSGIKNVGEGYISPSGGTSVGGFGAGGFGDGGGGGGGGGGDGGGGGGGGA
jgi:hypothetical protein